MDFTNILILCIVLTIVFFSSGIVIFNSSHLEFIKGFGKRNGLTRRIAAGLLSVITVTGRIRRAWIRMISQGSDLKS